VDSPKPEEKHVSKPEMISNYHCTLGENPLWNERDQALYWADIQEGKLYRYYPGSGKSECFYQGPIVGGFTFQEDDSLLLFEADRITLLDAAGKRSVLREGIDDDMQRFNDVMADPEGRVFAGTIGKDSQRGGLYRVDLDGTVTSLFKGTGCSNGMGFTPDLSQMYWTCTTRKKIFLHDYDRKTGELRNQRVWYDAKDDGGVPDGMTVDVDGCVWTTRWDGFCLLQLSTEGKQLQRFEFPVAKVSSVVFGGPELDQLYLTTAGGAPDSNTLDGAVFHVQSSTRGKPEFRSRVGL
jgi:D-xylonolactonase